VTFVEQRDVELKGISEPQRIGHAAITIRRLPPAAGSVQGAYVSW
jgi:hypothetical protein